MPTLHCSLLSCSMCMGRRLWNGSSQCSVDFQRCARFCSRPSVISNHCVSNSLPIAPVAAGHAAAARVPAAEVPAAHHAVAAHHVVAAHVAARWLHVLRFSEQERPREPNAVWLSLSIVHKQTRQLQTTAFAFCSWCRYVTSFVACRFI